LQNPAKAHAVYATREFIRISLPPVSLAVIPANPFLIPTEITIEEVKAAV
jgi:hypothetical protein